MTAILFTSVEWEGDMAKVRMRINGGVRTLDVEPQVSLLGDRHAGRARGRRAQRSH